MTVSYVPALERDVRHARVLVRQLDARHALLPLTSLVAILAIGLAYSGRTRASDNTALAPSSVALVNLNAVTDAKRSFPWLYEVLSLFCSYINSLGELS